MATVLVDIDTTQETVTIAVAKEGFLVHHLDEASFKKRCMCENVVKLVTAIEEGAFVFLCFGHDEADREERAAFFVCFFLMLLPSAVQETSMFFFTSEIPLYYFHSTIFIFLIC